MRLSTYQQQTRPYRNSGLRGSTSTNITYFVSSRSPHVERDFKAEESTGLWVEAKSMELGALELVFCTGLKSCEGLDLDK